MDRIFKRKIYKKMLEWKQTKNGSTALLIKGARRIGKSTIAQQFAKNEYKSYIAIDFADAPQAVWEAIKNISDRDSFFMQLQFIYGVQLFDRQSVIVFDEIQKCPEARQAIKYLVKDGRYDYIETGSLLSIKKSTQNITIPSEETRLTMYPMDYEEFLWALGRETIFALLKSQFDSKRPFGDAVVRKLQRDFRLYILVGGMPQAINTYLNTQNLSLVDETKREILELYIDDFLKIDPSGKAGQLFRSIPSQLTSHAKTYQEKKITGRSQDRDKMLVLLKEMEDSMTVNISHHANDPNVGLPMHADFNQYKMYLCDTGLFITLAFMDKEITENIIYSKLLSDKLPTDLGYVYENVVSQMLVANGIKLFYYTWATESGKHNYEIDFLLSKGTKISPVEVKSSGYNTHKSLDLFISKFSNRISQPYLLYTKDIRKDGIIWLLPVFLTPFI